MVQSLQEDYYDSQRDYLSGSPHLKHRQLNELLIGFIGGAITDNLSRGLGASILEIGGGDGTVTERMLAQGFKVTSTDMSQASVERMVERFKNNDAFRAVHDETGSLEVLGDQRYEAIIFASVLHHIPNYLAALKGAIDAHLEVGGSVITVQDPLWYSRLTQMSRWSSSGAYLSWRASQGDLVRGLKTRLRRSISGFSETDMGDAVEYHVVRDGVDEQAILDQLSPLFREANLLRYWSTQGAPQQRLGEKLGLLNTFAIRATDYQPSP